MIHTISQYTQRVAMIIIFTSVINLIMPNGGFRKYIKLVLGLIIIITILDPINTVIFKNKPNYTDILKKYETNIETTSMQIHTGEYLEAQKDIILEHYKDKLVPQMTDIIEKSNKVDVRALDISLNEDTDSRDFGTITAIDMVVTQAKETADQNKIKVPKIKVGSKETQSYQGDQIQGQIQEKIKKSLIDFYNLSQVNINIIVQKNS